MHSVFQSLPQQGIRKCALTRDQRRMNRTLSKRTTPAQRLPANRPYLFQRDSAQLSALVKRTLTNHMPRLFGS
jgi:hypothetical protein